MRKPRTIKANRGGPVKTFRPNPEGVLVQVSKANAPKSRFYKLGPQYEKEST